MATEKKDYARLKADEVIAALENGTAKWIQPWKPGEMPARPMNPLTGDPYKGANRFFLTIAQPDNDPRWLTWKQAQKMGCSVKDGEEKNYTPIFIWKTQGKKLITDEKGKAILDAEGNKQYKIIHYDRPFRNAAFVYHASQIDGLPELPPQEPIPEWQRHADAERILAACQSPITHGGNSAYYQPSTDKIRLPERHQFPTPDAYYATALHEFGHSTGHPSRLDRDLSGGFGSQDYAIEELRAEMFSLMLGQEIGIGHDPEQHHAYIAHWIEKLKNDPEELFRAARDAQSIMDYTHERVKEYKQELADEQAYTATLTPAYFTHDRLEENAELGHLAGSYTISDSSGMVALYVATEQQASTLTQWLNTTVDTLLTDPAKTLPDFPLPEGIEPTDQLQSEIVEAVQSQIQLVNAEHAEQEPPSSFVVSPYPEPPAFTPEALLLRDGKVAQAWETAQQDPTLNPEVTQRQWVKSAYTILHENLQGKGIDPAATVAYIQSNPNPDVIKALDQAHFVQAITQLGWGNDETGIVLACAARVGTSEQFQTMQGMAERYYVDGARNELVTRYQMEDALKPALEAAGIDMQAAINAVSPAVQAAVDRANTPITEKLLGQDGKPLEQITLPASNQRFDWNATEQRYLNTKNQVDMIGSALYEGKVLTIGTLEDHRFTIEVPVKSQIIDRMGQPLHTITPRGVTGIYHWDDQAEQYATNKGLILTIGMLKATDNHFELDTNNALQALGEATITSVGSENIYMEKDGVEYYAKIYRTEDFQVGPHDFSNETFAGFRAEQRIAAQQIEQWAIQNIIQRVDALKPDPEAEFTIFEVETTPAGIQEALEAHPDYGTANFHAVLPMVSHQAIRKALIGTEEIIPLPDKPSQEQREAAMAGVQRIRQDIQLAAQAEKLLAREQAGIGLSNDNLTPNETTNQDAAPASTSFVVSPFDIDNAIAAQEEVIAAREALDTDVIHFNDNSYDIRTVTVLGQTLTVGTTDLQTVLLESDSEEAEDIDNQIAYYVEPDEISLPEQSLTALLREEGGFGLDTPSFEVQPSPEIQIGDKVAWLNGYNLIFPNANVLDILEDNGEKSYVVSPETPWYGIPAHRILARDNEILNSQQHPVITNGETIEVHSFGSCYDQHTPLDPSQPETEWLPGSLANRKDFYEGDNKGYGVGFEAKWEQQGKRTIDTETLLGAWGWSKENVALWKAQDAENAAIESHIRQEISQLIADNEAYAPTIENIAGGWNLSVGGEQIVSYRDEQKATESLSYVNNVGAAIALTKLHPERIPEGVDAVKIIQGKGIQKEGDWQSAMLQGDVYYEAAQRLATAIRAEEIDSMVVPDYPLRKTILEASQNATEGYNAQESLENLERVATANGMTVQLSASTGEHDGITLNYLKGGKPTGVTTELLPGDGKAVTSFKGERIQGTGYTSDLEWQQAALQTGITAFHHSQIRQDVNQLIADNEAYSPELAEKDGEWQLIVGGETITSYRDETEATKALSFVNNVGAASALAVLHPERIPEGMDAATIIAAGRNPNDIFISIAVNKQAGIYHEAASRLEAAQDNSSDKAIIAEVIQKLEAAGFAKDNEAPLYPSYVKDGIAVTPDNGATRQESSVFLLSQKNPDVGWKVNVGRSEEFGEYADTPYTAEALWQQISAEIQRLSNPLDQALAAQEAALLAKEQAGIGLSNETETGEPPAASSFTRTIPDTHPSGAPDGDVKNRSSQFFVEKPFDIDAAIAEQEEVITAREQQPKEPLSDKLKILEYLHTDHGWNEPHWTRMANPNGSSFAHGHVNKNIGGAVPSELNTNGDKMVSVTLDDRHRYLILKEGLSDVLDLDIRDGHGRNPEQPAFYHEDYDTDEGAKRVAAFFNEKVQEWNNQQANEPLSTPSVVPNLSPIEQVMGYTVEGLQQDIATLQKQAEGLGLNVLSQADFQAEINEGQRTGRPLKTISKEIDDNIRLREELHEGKRTPQSIMGKLVDGLNQEAAKASAASWLDGEIERLTQAEANNGQTYPVNLSNYQSYLQGQVLPDLAAKYGMDGEKEFTPARQNLLRFTIAEAKLAEYGIIIDGDSPGTADLIDNDIQPPNSGIIGVINTHEMPLSDDYDIVDLLPELKQYLYTPRHTIEEKDSPSFTRTIPDTHPSGAPDGDVKNRSSQFFEVTPSLAAAAWFLPMPGQNLPFGKVDTAQLLQDFNGRVPEHLNDTKLQASRRYGEQDVDLFTGVIKAGTFFAEEKDFQHAQLQQWQTALNKHLSDKPEAVNLVGTIVTKALQEPAFYQQVELFQRTGLAMELFAIGETLTAPTGLEESPETLEAIGDIGQAQSWKMVEELPYLNPNSTQRLRIDVKQLNDVAAIGQAVDAIKSREAVLSTLQPDNWSAQAEDIKQLGQALTERLKELHPLPNREDPQTQENGKAFRAARAQDQHPLRAVKDLKPGERVNIPDKLGTISHGTHWIGATVESQQARSITLLMDTPDGLMRKTLSHKAMQGGTLYRDGAFYGISDKDRNIAAPAAVPAPRLAAAKTWLSVPFDDIKKAKQAAGQHPQGGKAIDFDPAEKRWFAHPGANLDKLTQWIPENRPRGSEQERPVTPEEEFAKFLKDKGFILNDKTMTKLDGGKLLDGNKHRCMVEGDEAGQMSGQFTGYSDRHPVAYIKNFREKTEEQWVYTGNRTDQESQATFTRKTEAEQAAALAKLKERMETAAAANKANWDELPPCPADNRYLKSKGLDVPDPATTFGVKQDQRGNMVVPLRDKDGKLWNMERKNVGFRGFGESAKTIGCFHVIGGRAALKDNPSEPVIIATGFSTAASIHLATGQPVVVAFSDNNLKAVAEEFRQIFPQRPMLICGDDDRHLPLKQPKPSPNSGREAATDAANAVGGKVVFPRFKPDTPPSKEHTDFDDVRRQQGLDALKRQVTQALAQARGTVDNRKDQEKASDKDKGKAVATAGAER